MTQGGKFEASPWPLGIATDVLWSDFSSPLLCLGTVADLFTGVLQNGYGPPDGFCFDIFCGDTPIVVSMLCSVEILVAVPEEGREL